MTKFRARVFGLQGVVVGTILASTALAIPTPPIPANERQVYLVRQDQSDCQNNNVPNQDGPNVSGIVTVIRGQDGNTTVNVALTGTPNTTYHFFLKCVRQLGDIKTGYEGTGITCSCNRVYSLIRPSSRSSDTNLDIGRWRRCKSMSRTAVQDLRGCDL